MEGSIPRGICFSSSLIFFQILITFRRECFCFSPLPLFQTTIPRSTGNSLCFIKQGFTHFFSDLVVPVLALLDEVVLDADGLGGGGGVCVCWERGDTWVPVVGRDMGCTVPTMGVLKGRTRRWGTRQLTLDGLAKSLDAGGLVTSLALIMTRWSGPSVPSLTATPCIHKQTEYNIMITHEYRNYKINVEKLKIKVTRHIENKGKKIPFILVLMTRPGSPQ